MEYSKEEHKQENHYSSVINDRGYYIFDDKFVVPGSAHNQVEEVEIDNKKCWIKKLELQMLKTRFIKLEDIVEIRYIPGATVPFDYKHDHVWSKVDGYEVIVKYKVKAK